MGGTGRLVTVYTGNDPYEAVRIAKFWDDRVNTYLTDRCHMTPEQKWDDLIERILYDPTYGKQEP